MAGVEFQITVNEVADVLALLDEVQDKTLEEWGIVAEGYAIEKCPVDTSNLANSISHQVDIDNSCVEVGTNVEYGIYVEYGTGIHAEEGNGRQTPWWYKDKEGNWVRTHGQRPQPFIRPAISDHTDEYRSILHDNLLNA